MYNLLIKETSDQETTEISLPRDFGMKENGCVFSVHSVRSTHVYLVKILDTGAQGWSHIVFMLCYGGLKHLSFSIFPLVVVVISKDGANIKEVVEKLFSNDLILTRFPRLFFTLKINI
jgi:hypothetical protein